MNHTDASQDATLLNLHAQLLAGDPVVTEKIVTVCLRSVERILGRRHVALPREVITDAACDALLTYFHQPARFEPTRGQLIPYLVSIGDFRLRDWLRARIRRDSREIYVGGTVELATYESKYLKESISKEPEMTQDIDTYSPEMERLVEQILPDPRDRAVLALIMEGRTEVEVYAAKLGLSDLSAEDRRIEVKRNRDRVLKRLQRRRASFDAVRGSDHGG